MRHAQAGFTSVLIYEKGGMGWRRIAAAKLTAKHTFSVKVAPQTLGTWRLFAVYKHTAGTATAKARSDVLAITVTSAPGDWVAVAGGGYHSLALKSDGSLWAWGDNEFGQLGLGDTKDREIPNQVGTAKDWAAVTGGHGQSFALKRDGSLWAWGSNKHGQLGLGEAVRRLVPNRVGTANDWAAVVGGHGRSLALKSDGSLWAWG